MADITKMITELYEKIILKQAKEKAEAKPRKVTLKQFFVMSYVKERIFRDLTPFSMTRGDIDDISNLAAQITFKLLTFDQKQAVERQYNQMTDEQLEHLKSI